MIQQLSQRVAQLEKLVKSALLQANQGQQTTKNLSDEEQKLIQDFSDLGDQEKEHTFPAGDFDDNSWNQNNPTVASWANMMKTDNDFNLRPVANDSKRQREERIYQLGKEIAKKYNPHYKQN